MFRPLTLFAIAAATVAAMAAVPATADTKKTAKQVLATFRLMDLDGNEVELEGDALRERKLAICFLASWSEVSTRQAAAVASGAAKAAFDGKLVFVTSGPEREVRGLRARLAAPGSVWLKGEKSVPGDFENTFDPKAQVNRVPALIVVGKSRSVLHASMGELTGAEIAAALAASGG